MIVITFKSRDNRNYLLYCDNYKFKNVNRKVFNNVFNILSI